MSSFHFGDPYRPPCGDWPNYPVFNGNGPWDNYLTSENNIARYKNITVAKDAASNTAKTACVYVYAAPVGDEKPLTSLKSDGRNWPDCMVDGPPCDCPGPIKRPDKPYCQYGPWDPTKFIPVATSPPSPTAKRVGGNGSYVVPGPGGYTSSLGDNFYVLDNADPPNPVNYAKCKKMGFKNVQAKKTWHGMFGFSSHDPAGAPSWYQPFKSQVNPISPGCACEQPAHWETEQLAPDTTKYLKLRGHATIVHNSYVNENDQIKTTTVEETASCNISINRKSGLLELGSTFHWDAAKWDANLNAAYRGYAAPLLIQISGANSETCFSMYLNHLVYDYNLPVWSETGTSSSRTAVHKNQDNMDETVMTVTTGYSFEYTRSGYQYNSTATWVILSYGKLTVSPTAITWTGHGQSNCVSQTTSGYHTISDWTEDVTINLGNPDDPDDPNATYTTYKVLSDINDLLGKWDLTKDTVYPWRQDNFLTVAPLVSYNEVEYPVSPLPFVSICASVPLRESNITVTADNINHFDSNSLLFYNGGVLGAPLPQGYNSYYDYRHITWRCCIGDDGDEVPYIFKYGAWSHSNSATDFTDLLVPAAATQWTDNLRASTLWPGAWIAYGNVAESNQVWAQKWAETRIPRPSINFARPCGADRYQMDDENSKTTLCIANISFSSPTYSITVVGATTIVANDKIIIWPNDENFNTALSGVWSVTSVDNPNSSAPDIKVTAGTRIAAGVRPTGIIDPGAGILGKLRWPDAPAICGIGGDASHPYYVNDDNSKGDWLHVEWLHNFRDYQERERNISQHTKYSIAPTNCFWVSSSTDEANEIRKQQVSYGMPQSVQTLTLSPGCSKWNFCSPTVLCISPNNNEIYNHIDKWTNGRTNVFISTFRLDERYGSLWQSGYFQHLPDPFYSHPHAPCPVPPLSPTCEIVAFGLKLKVTAVDSAGAITSATVTQAGSGYTTSMTQSNIRNNTHPDVYGAKFKIASVNGSGGVTSVSITSGGSGYSVNDELGANDSRGCLEGMDLYPITTASTPAHFVVNSMTTTESAGLSLVNGGINYSTPSSLDLVVLKLVDGVWVVDPDKAGTVGASIDITSVDPDGVIYLFTPTGSLSIPPYIDGQTVGDATAARESLKLIVTGINPVVVNGENTGRGDITSANVDPDTSGIGYTVGESVTLFAYNTDHVSLPATFIVDEISVGGKVTLVSVAPWGGGSNYAIDDVLKLGYSSGARFNVLDAFSGILSNPVFTMVTAGVYNQQLPNPVKLVNPDYLDAWAYVNVITKCTYPTGESEDDIPCSWVEAETGNCPVDQAYNEDAQIPCIKYYPAHPVVEARVSCPVVNGVQTVLPTGVTVHVFPLYTDPYNPTVLGLDHAGLDLKTGNVMPPPDVAAGECSPNQVPYEYITNWALYENENICVCGSSRAEFVEAYKQDGVLCIA